MNNRKSNLELLRVLSMLAIVCGHSVTHGGYNELPLSFNGIFALFLSLGARIGVNCFILISGYFASDKLKYKKIVSLELQVLFYSIIIFAFVCMRDHSILTIKSTLQAITPSLSSTYWFATCFLLLSFMAPYLKVLTDTINQKQYISIMTVLGSIWCIAPSLHLGSPGYSNLAWMIYVYLIGIYIRKYPNKYFEKIKLAYGILFYLLLHAATVAIYVLGYENGFLHENARYLLVEMNTITGFLCSVLLFIGFKNLKLENIMINSIAKLVFGVYLFHDNPLIRNTLWIELFDNKDYIDFPTFSIRLFGSIIIVFVAGLIIEAFRQFIYNKACKDLCSKKTEGIK